MGGESVLPEVPGVPVDPQYEQELRNQICELMGWDNIHSFPGSQPVSFEKKHLHVLEQEDYLVCEKSDGLRYLMYMIKTQNGPAVFLADRKFHLRYVPLFFPAFDAVQSAHHQTLLDGELVLDVEGNKRRVRFLIFDLMYCQGQRLIERAFTKRLAYCEERVIKPYQQSLRARPDLSIAQPFSVEMKPMYKSYGLAEVFDRVIPNLKHGNDGLIFTPVEMPYKPGTCQKLLKWKPADMNTIDFKIVLDYNPQRKPVYKLYVLSSGLYEFFDYLTPEPELQLEWLKSPPHGRIGEFRFDSVWHTVLPAQAGYSEEEKPGGWKFVRFRDDKNTANDKSVVFKILQSINDNVKQSELIQYCERIRTNWKNREKALLPSNQSSILLSE